jgi:quercetin dioxygenase-like cupin family protein
MKRETAAKSKGAITATINATSLEPVKKDERGTVYDCDGIMYVERKKGTITADHTHPEGEIIYLLKGRLELTIGKAVQAVDSPARFEVPPGIYHKLVALSDIIFLKSKL